MRKQGSSYPPIGSQTLQSEYRIFRCKRTHVVAVFWASTNVVEIQKTFVGEVKANICIALCAEKGTSVHFIEPSISKLDD